MGKTQEAVTAVAAPNAAGVPADKMAGLQRFMKLSQEHGKEIVSDRDKIKLELGDYVIARLSAIKQGGQGDKAFRIYELDGAEGQAWILLGAGNLDQKLSGRLVGHVIGVANVGSQDIGQASPMTLYHVVDFGEHFPDVLPF